MEKKDRDIRELPLSKLKPHPANEKLYRKRSRQELDDLAADMEKHGQLEAIELTATFDIISGHGRVEAAKKLGWKTIRCWVRHDMDTPQAIETRLIEVNLHRRQMTSLDIARSWQRLKQLAKDRKGKPLGAANVKGDLRDLLAERFGLSGRTLDRWLQVITMPMPLQEAVDQDKLPLTLAVKAAVLGPEVQAKIARRIQAGENAKQVVKELVKETTRSHCHATTELDRFLTNIDRNRIALNGRIEEIRPEELVKRLEKLQRARAMLDQLIERAGE
jgi:ParB family chromosome partitioning protein